VPVVRRIPCVVREVTDHGEHVYTVELKPSITVPQFKPGQFLHLALDPFDGEGFWPESRIFSIASSPRERDSLKITYAVKGPFSSRMERELAPGATVWVKLPYGEFVIDPTRDAVLFAGGTGVTAFTAFLESLTPEQTTRVLLVYGVRTPHLFVYGPLVEERTCAVPSLSACLISEATQGRLRADSAWPAVATLHDPLFYLSGPPQMLNALTEQLLALDVPAKDIRIDAWE
jgi:ferredoxin-NADP reductase